jgi:1-acyl-sn-glycerol-3-phosphate acyltransferase
MTPLAASERPRVEQAVLDIVGELVAEVGGRAQRTAVGLDDSLDRALGLGSLERVELLVRLEAAFGTRLPDAVMAAADTPRALAAALLAAGPGLPEPRSGPAPPGPERGRTAPASVATLVDALRWHAETTPDRVHVYLREEDGEERPITYGALWDRAAAIAAGLAGGGVAAGERVALMLRTEEAFFAAFFGTLMAGAIPVPIYPPFRLDRLEEYARRQVGILRNAEASRLLTFAEAERLAGLLRARVPSLEEVTSVDRLVHPDRGPAPARRLAPDDAALIQYTSGSTGDPKGVLLSHANILANIRAIGAAIAIEPGDVGVSWLPLYHDMGLIGSWLAALHFGIPIVILSPLAFLSRPARWLWAIHAHRGTVSAAPNFAFDLCVRRIADAEIQGLDLRSWRLAFNGSEPVSPETIARFTRRFAPYGFRAAAMCPVYGLAEASVALCVPPLGRPPRVDRVDRRRFESGGEAWPAADEPAALAFVSGGRPLPGHEVRIVDPAGRPLGERTQGRVEFRGPSVSAGYFRNPEATRAALHDGWMDSGDFGYWADGELFLTGRQKDIIIKGGRNLHPAEVEEVVGAVPGIRKGCVAAFGLPDPGLGTERLVVVAETHELEPAAHERLRAAVIERVVDALGIPPDTAVIARPGSVLKTSSGKIRRAATRDAYARGELERGRPSMARQWGRLLAAATAARLRRLAGAAGRLVYTGYVGTLAGSTLAALWGLLWLVPPGRPADRLTRGWCRAMLALAGCRLRVTGREHLGGPGPVVLAPNHSSYLDAVALLAALPEGFRFVAKRELLTTPVLRTVVRRVGHLTVERVDLSQSTADAERVGAALRDGTSLIVFPEGTFRRPAGLLPFRLGAFKAAVEAQRPVIPVAIRGTREILPAYARCLRPGPITVTIGPPIPPDGTDWAAMVRLRDRVRDAIARRLE